MLEKLIDRYPFWFPYMESCSNLEAKVREHFLGSVERYMPSGCILPGDVLSFYLFGAPGLICSMKDLQSFLRHVES